MKKLLTKIKKIFIALVILAISLIIIIVSLAILQNRITYLGETNKCVLEVDEDNYTVGDLYYKDKYKCPDKPQLEKQLNSQLAIVYRVNNLFIFLHFFLYFFFTWQGLILTAILCYCFYISNL